MTPKEKAKELVEKFRVITIDKALRSCNTTSEAMERTAKECALICVDEILKIFKARQGGRINNEIGFESYWQEVKQEITNNI